MAQIFYKNTGYIDIPDDWDDKQVSSWIDQNEAKLDQDFGIAKPQEKKEASFLGDAARGIADTADLVQHGIPFAVNSVIGRKEAALQNAKDFTEAIKKNEENYPRAFKGDVTDISSVGEAYEFARQSIAEMAPSMILTLGAAGVGRYLAGRLIAGGMEKALASGIAKDVAEETAKKALLKGEIAGAVVGSGALNIPESGMTIAEETGDINAGAMLAAGGLKTALDTFTPLLMLRRMRGNEIADSVTDKILAKIGYKGETLKGRIGAGLAEGMLSEGATEGTQEAIDRLAVDIIKENPDFFREDNLKKIATAAAAGAIGGGFAGGAGGAFSGSKNKPEEEKPQADKKDPSAPTPDPTLRRYDEQGNEILAEQDPILGKGFTMSQDPTSVVKPGGPQPYQNIDDELETAYSAYKANYNKSLGKDIEAPLDAQAESFYNTILTGGDEQAKRDLINKFDKGIESSLAKKETQKKFAQLVKDAEESLGGLSSFKIGVDNDYGKMAKKMGLNPTEAKEALRMAGFGEEAPPVKGKPATNPAFNTFKQPTLEDRTGVADYILGAQNNEELEALSWMRQTLYDTLEDNVSTYPVEKKDGKELPININKLRQDLLNADKGKWRSYFNMTKFKKELAALPNVEERDGLFYHKKPTVKKVEEDLNKQDPKAGQATPNEVSTEPAAPLVKQEEQAPPPQETSSPTLHNIAKQDAETFLGLKGKEASAPETKEMARETYEGLNKFVNDPTTSAAEKAEWQGKMDQLNTKFDLGNKPVTPATKPTGGKKASSRKKADVSRADKTKGTYYLSEWEWQEANALNEDLKGKKASEVADYFAKRGSTLIRRMIASLVSNMIRTMEKAGFYIDFSIVEQTKDRGVPVNGKASMSGATVDIQITGLNGTYIGLTEKTILHELVHAVTMHALHIGSRKGAPERFKKFADNINALYEHMKKEEGVTSNTKFEGDLYYLANADEFLAEGLSNPITQFILSQSKGLNSLKTAWTNFVDTIRELIGLPKGEESAFTQLLTAFEDLSNATPKELEQLFAESTNAVNKLKKISRNAIIEPLDTVKQINTYNQWFNSLNRIGEKAGGPASGFAKAMIQMGRERSQEIYDSVIAFTPLENLEKAERSKAALVMLIGSANREAAVVKPDGSITVTAKHALEGANVKVGDTFTITGDAAKAVITANEKMDADWAKRFTALGVTPIPRNGYLPNVIDGDHIVTVVYGGPEGRIARVSGVDTSDYGRVGNKLAGRMSGEAKLRKIAQELQDKHPGADIIISNNKDTLPRQLSHGSRLNVLLSLKGAMDAEQNPLLKGNIFEEELKGATLNSIRKHYLEQSKEFVDGAIREGEDPYEALAHSLGKFSQDMANGITRLKYHPEINKNLNLMKENLAYKHNKLHQWAINQVNYASTTAEEFSFARAMAFHVLLGFNFSSAVIQLFQMPLNTIPVMMGFGGPRALGSYMKSLKQAKELIKILPIRIENGRPVIDMKLIEAHGLNEEALSKQPADIQAEIRRLVATGALSNASMANVIARNRFDLEGTKFVNNKLIHNVLNASGYMFGLAELTNRLTTYLMTRDQMLTNPEFVKNMEAWKNTTIWKDEPLDLQLAGRIMIDKTQFDPARTNRPQIVQGWRSMPTQFMGWVFFTFELYGSLIDQAISGKEGKAAAAKSLAYMALTMFFFAGLMGMPFAENLDALVRAITKAMPGLFPNEISLRQEIEKLITKGMGENAVTTMMLGPASAISGLAIGSRLGLGKPLPTDALTGGIISGSGPATSTMVDRGMRAFQDMSKGDFGSAMWHVFAPQALQNVNEGLRMIKPVHDVMNKFDEGLEKVGLGKAHPFKGLTSRSGDIKVAPEHLDSRDALAKIAGFQSVNINNIVSERGKENFEREKTASLKAMYKDRIKTNFVDAFISQKYNEPEAARKFMQRAIQERQALQKYLVSAPPELRFTIDMNRLYELANLEAEGYYMDKKMKGLPKEVAERIKAHREALQRQIEYLRGTV